MGKPVEVGVVCGEREEAPPGPALPGALGGARRVETRSRPARREMRSARSASRLVAEGLCWWPRPGFAGGRWPRWPSLMAVVDRADSEVVVLVGVPLEEACTGQWVGAEAGLRRDGEGTHGISDGVSGLEPGGGRLMKVGCVACAIATVVARRLEAGGWIVKLPRDNWWGLRRCRHWRGQAVEDENPIPQAKVRGDRTKRGGVSSRTR